MHLASTYQTVVRRASIASVQVPSSTLVLRFQESVDAWGDRGAFTSSQAKVCPNWGQIGA